MDYLDSLVDEKRFSGETPKELYQRGIDRYKERINEYVETKNFTKDIDVLSEEEIKKRKKAKKKAEREAKRKAKLEKLKQQGAI